TEKARHRVVVARLETAIAQNRIADPGERPHLLGQANFRRDALQVAVPAGDELRPAVDDEVALPFASHAAAGYRFAFEDLHRVPTLLQPPGTRQSRDAPSHHDDRSHSARCLHGIVIITAWVNEHQISKFFFRNLSDIITAIVVLLLLLALA